jgi:hypothetical protein
VHAGGLLCACTRGPGVAAVRIERAALKAFTGGLAR